MDNKFNLTSLKTKTRNPRKISEAELERLKRSVNEFSKMLSLRPIVYDPETNEVLGGNQRLRALLETGHKLVPSDWVKSIQDFTEEEKKRFVLVDNSMFGEWDSEMIMEDYEKDELEKYGFNLNEIANGVSDLLEEIVDGDLKKEIKKEEIRGFIKTHILLSFSPEKLIDIQDYLNEILKVNGIEYEQGSN